MDAIKPKSDRLTHSKRTIVSASRSPIRTDRNAIIIDDDDDLDMIDNHRNYQLQLSVDENRRRSTQQSRSTATIKYQPSSPPDHQSISISQDDHPEATVKGLDSRHLKSFMNLYIIKWAKIIYNLPISPPPMIRRKTAADNAVAKLCHNYFESLVATISARYTRSISLHCQTASRSVPNRSSSSSSLISLIWLPLILIVLLPQFKSPSTTTTNLHENHPPTIILQQLLNDGQQYHHPPTSQFLLDLIRFPWDRLKLISFGPLISQAQLIHQQQQPQQIMTTNGQQVAHIGKLNQLRSVAHQQLPAEARQDLAEEESHVLLLNPNEVGGANSAARQPPTYQAYRLAGQSSLHMQTGPEVASGYEPMSMQQGYAGETSGAQEYATASQGGEQQLVAESPSTSASSYNLQPEATSTILGGNGEHVANGRQRTAPIVSASSSSSSTTLQARADLPTVSALNVKCEKNHMKVNIVFDRPFYGVVFSKGHYSDKKCVHLQPGSGQTSVNFEINMGKCGLRDSRQTLLQQDGNSMEDGSEPNTQMVGQYNGATSGPGSQQQPHGVYIENTIIIQYDSQVQEIYDQARRLRCTWYDYYEKSVTFRPYDVDMLDAVTANFLGDNIQCWMQIQVGKGPKSSEVAGLVKIGQTMTMVLAIKDDENRFDMLVRNCIAHDGKHAPIQLVDEYGCVARPKIMGQFQKSRSFGPQATVVSYAHFQAFKFPDSLSVHFQCVIQVCRTECPPLNCNDQGNNYNGNQMDGGSRLTGSAQTVGFGMGMSNAAPGPDYATSGTEVVATKEHLPIGHHLHPHHHHSQQHSMIMSPNNNNYAPLMPITGNVSSSSGASTISLHSAELPPNHYHQIKLDDSQGRVQVKLDTSMLAGTRYQAPVMGSGSAPPPMGSILSSSAPASLVGGGGSGPATPISGFQLPRGHTHRYQSGLLNSASPSTASAYKPTYGGTSAAGSMNLAGPGTRASLGMTSQRGPQVSNYSPQYPSSNMAAAASMVQRAAYATNRIGELAPGARAMQDESAREDNSMSMTTFDNAGLQHESTGSSLSLLATPRALRGGPEIISTGNHQQQQQQRSKRSLPSENLQSTSIQTQKTIQVISPEDVAFSLNGNGLGNSASSGQMSSDDISITQSQMSNKSGINEDGSISTTVCFSAARFIIGILLALSLIVISLAVAAVLLVRQHRNGLKLRQKEGLQSINSPFAAAARLHLYNEQTKPTATTLHNQQQLANSDHHRQTQNQQHHQIDNVAAETRRRFCGGYFNRIYTQFSQASQHQQQNNSSTHFWH